MRTPISRVRWLTENDDQAVHAGRGEQQGDNREHAEHAGEQIRSTEILDDHGAACS